MSNIVQYGDFGTYELEEVTKEEAWAKGGSSKYMKLGLGRNVVRFLPPPMGKKSPFVYVFQHFINLPGYPGPIIFNCPRLMQNSPCPACIKSDKFARSSNPADNEAAKSLWATRRIFANVIDRRDEVAGPKILGFGKGIYETLLNLRKDPASGGDFTHPLHGFDIIITREGTGKNDTSYIVTVSRQTTELGNPEWIAQQADLSSLAKVHSFDEIRQMFAPPKEEEPIPQIEGQATFTDDDIPF